MNLEKLKATRGKRKRSLQRHRAAAQKQRTKWQETKKRGHLRAAKKNSRKAKRDAKAIRKLNPLITKAEAAANRPSPNFSYREFYCNDGRRFPESAKPHIDKLCKEVLEPIRKEFGTVRINSAYRHASYNAAIGGASQSYHNYDIRSGKAPAADITCGKGTPDQWAAAAARHGADGIGIYRGSNFTHLDQRGYSSKWFG